MQANKQYSPLDTFEALAVGLPIRLRFVVDGGSMIEVAGYETIILGRQLDKVGTIVDFARFDGAKLGVSRRHAEIAPQDGRLMIQDLQSINGTWLNGEKLDPETRYPLNHGDQLRLGELHLQVWYLGGNYNEA